MAYVKGTVASGCYCRFLPESRRRYRGHRRRDCRIIVVVIVVIIVVLSIVIIDIFVVTVDIVVVTVDIVIGSLPPHLTYRHIHLASIPAERNGRTDPFPPLEDK